MFQMIVEYGAFAAQIQMRGGRSETVSFICNFLKGTVSQGTSTYVYGYTGLNGVSYTLYLELTPLQGSF